MSHDVSMRLRELEEELRQEENRIQVVGRALTDAEIRRVDALGQAREWLQRAREALESAPPQQQGQGAVMRGDPDDLPLLAGDDDTAGYRHERSGPVENSGLAGDDDTPGYGRGARGGY